MVPLIGVVMEVVMEVVTAQLLMGPHTELISLPPLAWPFPVVKGWARPAAPSLDLPDLAVRQYQCQES